LGPKIVGDVDKNKAQKYIGLGRGRGRKYKNIEALNIIIPIMAWDNTQMVV